MMMCRLWHSDMCEKVSEYLCTHGSERMLTHVPLLEALAQALAHPLAHPIHQNPTWEGPAESE